MKSKPEEAGAGCDVAPEDEERSMQVMANFNEMMRQEAVEASKKKKEDHLTSCRDCGKFTDKSRWIERFSSLAMRGHRPICAPCFDEYDDGGMGW